MGDDVAVPRGRDQHLPAGISSGAKPVTASWKPRISRAARVRRPAGASRSNRSGQGTTPGMNSRTSEVPQISGQGIQ